MSLVISKEIGEFLAGHSAYLSGSYRRYDDETVAGEYLKAMHMVSVAGSKEVKELENELKEKIAEQSVKTEKHADTMIQIIEESMKMKNEMRALQEQNAALQVRLQNIEQVSEEQNKNLNLMVGLWGELAIRSAERSKDPELMKGVKELLNNYNASRS
jgi:predicted RNase H-like nuclease (RuvC/YqgF family)